MTFAWADPTELASWSPPPFVTVGEQEGELDYSPRPSKQANLAKLDIKGAGIAEVKPHNEPNIRDAHNSLLTRPFPPWLPTSPPPIKLIITYRPHPWDDAWNPPPGSPARVRSGWKRPPEYSAFPTHVDVFAVAHNPNLAKGGEGIVTRYLRDAEWAWVGRAPVRPLPVDLRNRSVFGSAGEALARETFDAALRRGTNPQRRVVNLRKSGHAVGADVIWREMAEMYGELARTTNDEFLGELANELATLG
jgi:hypothetical protein